MNAARIVGPLLAGLIISSFGSAWVFMLNAVLSLAAAFTIMRWKRVHKPHPLGREPLFTAMRVGLQYVVQSSRLKGILARISVFFFHSTALMALLPIKAKMLNGGSAASFTLLLASMGTGALAAATFLPRIRGIYIRDALVLRGACAQACVMAVVAYTDQLWVAVLAMVIGGASWITTANTLNLSIQLALPDWVRARGMSVYLMSVMGANAIGAAAWGHFAGWTSVSASLIVAATAGTALMFGVMRCLPDDGSAEDLSPSTIFPLPQHADVPASGRICIVIEYRIDPNRATEFRRLMNDQSRKSRLRQGALSWELLQDIGNPGRFFESIVDNSWVDHLRRFDRVTAADAKLYEKRLEFHTRLRPPKVTRYLMDEVIALKG